MSVEDADTRSIAMPHGQKHFPCIQGKRCYMSARQQILHALKNKNSKQIMLKQRKAKEYYNKLHSSRWCGEIQQ